MGKHHEQDDQATPLIRQHNLGVGVAVDLTLGDHGLFKTVEALFGRVDFELSTIFDALPLPPGYRRQALAGLTELLSAAKTDLDKSAADLPQGSVAVQHRVIPVIVHSPYAAHFLEVIRAADRVLTGLRAAWILGQLPEENHEAQARQVRGQIHRLASAVDALFRACLDKTRSRNGDRAGGDAWAGGGDA